MAVARIVLHPVDERLESAAAGIRSPCKSSVDRALARLARGGRIGPPSVPTPGTKTRLAGLPVRKRSPAFCGSPRYLTASNHGFDGQNAGQESGTFSRIESAFNCIGSEAASFDRLSLRNRQSGQLLSKHSRANSSLYFVPGVEGLRQLRDLLTHAWSIVSAEHSASYRPVRTIGPPQRMQAASGKGRLNPEDQAEAGQTPGHRGLPGGARFLRGICP
jgi:hypothetical protein